MSIFDDLDTAKPSSPKGNYFRFDGRYIVKNMALKAENKRKGDCFISSWKVIKVLEGGKDGQDTHRPGEELDKVSTKYGAGADYFLPEIKAVLMALAGVPQDNHTEITAGVAEAAVAPDQPFAGTCIEMHVRCITTQTGNPFTCVEPVRLISYTELSKKLSQEEKDEFFPGMNWESAIAAESE